MHPVHIAWGISTHLHQDELLSHTLRRLGICIPIRRREPRGLGFVEFSDPKDAEEARHCMDGSTVAGRVVSALPCTLHPST